MENKKRLILVTNDDGISVKGLRILINSAKKFGNVIVVAPDSVQSAKSHSISQALPVSYKKIEANETYSEYSCSGTPVDCVKIAIHKILDVKPDLILSGVNHGSNTSVSVIYSGTMAAAVEGTLNNIPSIGFSVNCYDFEADFSQTSGYIETIVKQVLEKGLPEGIALNVNFPNLEKQKLKGIRVARGVKGNWKEKFVSAANPHYKDVYWLKGQFINYEPDATDTDEYFINNGYVSVVPVKFDFTAYQFIEELTKWEIEVDNESENIGNQ